MDGARREEVGLEKDAISMIEQSSIYRQRIYRLKNPS
jgi:hypothetical protein